MNMLAACAGLAILLTPIASAPGIRSADAVPLPGPGFSTAAFPNTLLNTILSDRDCSAVRFYNIIAPSNPAAGTLMVVGIRTDGTEINGGLFAHPYKANTPSGQDPVANTALTRAQAAEACAAMQRTGDQSFSTTMTKADLQAVMGFQGSTAVQLRPASGGGVLRVAPVKVEGGRIVELDPGGGASRNTSDPCPVACGLRGNYVNEAQLPR